MTTPPLIAPTQVEGVFDQELTADLDAMDEATYCGCALPAMWLSAIQPCGHEFVLCTPHKEQSDGFWADVLIGTARDPRCKQCDTPATERTVRPI